MAKQRTDYSVQSANSPTLENELYKGKDFSVYRCMITNVIYTDSPENVTKNSKNPQVIYEAVVLGGFKEGQLIDNIRLSSNLGGDLNYSERILKKTTKRLKVDPLSSHDGDIVFVVFLQGDSSFPIIIGTGTNHQDTTKTGATKSDGPRMVQEYNGIKVEVTKNGDMTLTRKGGSFNSTENTFTTDEAGEKVKVELEGEKTTFTYESGLVVDVDGANDKMDITTAGGAKMSVDGTSGTIELQDNGTGKVKITGDKIAIGASSAELLQQISDQLEKIIDWANNTGAVHTHIGNLGYSTAPPTQASAYTQLGTDLNTIKGLVDGIKGSL